jgi:hypothetical protein
MHRSSRVAFEPGAGNNLSHDTIHLGDVEQILAIRVYLLPGVGPYVAGQAAPGHRAERDNAVTKWSITRWAPSLCVAMRRMPWPRRKGRRASAGCSNEREDATPLR